MAIMTTKQIGVTTMSLTEAAQALSLIHIYGLGVTLDELTLKKAPENHQEPETVDELINLFVKKFLEALGKGEKDENQW